MAVLNNLVDLTAPGSAEMNEEHYADIILATEEQLERAIVFGQNITTVEPNVALVIATQIPTHPSEFTFVVLSGDDDDFRKEDLQVYSHPTNIMEDRRVSVSLPASIFNITSQAGNGKILRLLFT